MTKYIYMLSTKNTTILAFYKKHPHLDFEQQNLIFINLMENIMKNFTNNVGSDTNSVLIKELSDKFNILVNSSQVQNNRLNTLTNDICKENNCLLDKYLVSIREMIIANNNTTHTDILTKISNNYEHFSKEFSINSNAKSLLLDQKYNIKSELEHIFNERNKEITDSLILLKDRNERVMSKIIDNEHKNQYCSSSKGQNGENNLLVILTDEFPEAEIIDTHGIHHSGDFIIQHKNKPKILIDTKHYDSKHVPTSEVTKILNDMESCDCHGILISQKSGINHRKNFEISLHNNKIIIFITHCEYNGKTIRLAVNTIEQLSETLNSLYTPDSNGDNSLSTISCEYISDLNTDYQTFIRDRNEIIKRTKKHQKELIVSLNRLTLCSLEQFLKNRVANTQNFGAICPHCNKTCVNKRGLGTHLRTCSQKTATKAPAPATKQH
jgi:hypothetical protein